MNKRWNPDFRSTFKGVSTRFGLRTIEKSVENPDFIFCSSFQNLRLGSIILEGWTKDEIRISKEALFKGVSTRFGWDTNRWKVLPRETHSETLVRPSTIFVWDFESIFDQCMNIHLMSRPISFQLVCRCAIFGFVFLGHRIYAPPNEDFGRMNKRWNPDFRLTFQWFVAQIEYSHHWKVLRKRIRKGWLDSLWIPNEEFSRVEQIVAYDFWTSFQSVAAQKEYSHPWKVLQKRTRNALFNRPKSLFGGE